MGLHEIVLPETKPETEWVRGRALQKMSATYAHARLQTLLAAALTDWAEAANCGRVGTEWRFRVTPRGSLTRPLVPDIGYLSYDALSADARFDDVQVPLAPPTVAVEILSPDDRRVDVDDKLATYLGAGTALVVLVDFSTALVELHDVVRAVTLDSDDVLEHPALPGFTLDLGALFRRAQR